MWMYEWELKKGGMLGKCKENKGKVIQKGGKGGAFCPAAPVQRARCATRIAHRKFIARPDAFIINIDK